MFMDFGKLDDEEGRNKCGTGLGLSICKQIIEQMGGSVKVKSEIGRGTDFIIDLKIKTKVTKFELDSEQMAVWMPYLEDISCDQIMPKCKKYFEVMEAKPISGGLHSIVNLDESMVELPQFSKKTSQIYKDEYNMPECMPARKYSIPQLQSSKKASEEEKVPEPDRRVIVIDDKDDSLIQDGHLTKFKCLIANDDNLQLTILEALFERNGFEVVTASNGQVAYEEVLRTASPNSKKFDLIVLDLCMPVTDGHEACQLILAHYKSSSQRVSLMPKVIAVSGYVDANVQAETAKSGFE